MSTCHALFMQPPANTSSGTQAVYLHAGGKAFTKHAHRASDGWWGLSTGSNANKNATAEKVFARIVSERYMSSQRLNVFSLTQPSVPGRIYSGCHTVFWHTRCAFRLDTACVFSETQREPAMAAGPSEGSWSLSSTETRVMMPNGGTEAPSHCQPL